MKIKLVKGLGCDRRPCLVRLYRLYLGRVELKIQNISADRQSSFFVVGHNRVDEAAALATSRTARRDVWETF